MKNGCPDYAALLRWSTEDLDGFRAATERDLRIAWRTPYTHVLDTARGLPWTTWWTGGRGDYRAAAPPPHRDRGPVIPPAEAGTGPTPPPPPRSHHVAGLPAPPPRLRPQACGSH